MSPDNHVLSWSPNPNVWYPTNDAHNIRSLNVETQEGKPLFPQDLKGWSMTQPVVSPDGKKMAIYWYEDNYWGASLFTLGSLTNSHLHRGAFPFGWSSDGVSLYAFSWLDGREIMQLKVGDSKKPRSVITMPGAINAATISPDGRRIIVSVGEEKSDMWLMKNFDPQEARAQ
jgi:Tol biopolymer transport system component